jgi:cellulose synthase/poly-beta-1,6-N-acetylglucosamine synthase-like glycosyltransferase
MLMIVGLVLSYNIFKSREDILLYDRLMSLNSRPDLKNTSRKVSILIAAWNEKDIVCRCIESILSLRYANKELVICAGGADGTYDAARRYDGDSIHVLEQQPREGKQIALRRCLEFAAGDVVFLTDADCVLTDQVFEATLKPILDENEVVVTGSYEPLSEQRLLPLVSYQWAIQLYGRARSAAYSAGLVGANSAVRRAELEASGGFDATIGTGTDYFLARQLSRAGHHIRAMPGSAVATGYETDLQGYMRQRSRWLRNLLLHGWSHRSGADVRHVLVTGTLGLLGLTLPLAGLLGVRRAWGIWLCLFLHSIAARLRYLYLARSIGIAIPRGTLLWLPLFLGVDWLIGGRALFEACVPGRRWRW